MKEFLSIDNYTNITKKLKSLIYKKFNININVNEHNGYIYDTMMEINKKKLDIKESNKVFNDTFIKYISKKFNINLERIYFKEAKFMIKYLLIDSKNRNKSIYPDPNSYKIDLKNSINNIIEIHLISAIIPNTVYPIDIHNNILTLIQQSETKNMYLTIGSYTLNQLATELQYQLNLSKYIGYDDYVVEYNTLNDKYTITNTNQFTLKFGNNIKYDEKSIGRILGFLPKSYEGNSISSVNNTDLNTLDYVILSIKEIIDFNKKENNVNYFCKFPLWDMNFGEIKYTTGLLKNFNKPQNISKLTIKYTTPNNNLCNFHGYDNTLLFKVKYIPFNSNLVKF